MFRFGFRVKDTMLIPARFLSFLPESNKRKNILRFYLKDHRHLKVKFKMT